MVVISLILTLALVGFVLWIVIRYVPMPEPFQRAILALTILVVVVWVFRVMWGTGLVPLLK